MGAQPTSTPGTAGSADRSAASTARLKPTMPMAARTDAVTAALAEHFPGAEVSGITAGLHIIARLPQRFGPQPEFLRRADAAGIALRPLSDYGTADADDLTVRLVLGYAHLVPAEIARGIHLLSEAVGAANEPGTA